MRIFLNERFVERCMDPANPNYLKATRIHSQIIDTYISNIVPRVGEIIWTDKGSYDVVAVEYHRHCSEVKGDGIMCVTLEVAPHKLEKSFSFNGYCIKEEWPLISDIDTDLSNFPTLEEEC